MFIIASLSATLGLTWIFGFLMLFSTDETYNKVMAWLFTISNTFQVCGWTTGYFQHFAVCKFYLNWMYLWSLL